MGTDDYVEMSPDECIGLELARMAAMPPLGGVARLVWGRASVPDEHTSIVAEVGTNSAPTLTTSCASGASVPTPGYFQRSRRSSPPR
jgi:hypothetical protein